MAYSKRRDGGVKSMSPTKTAVSKLLTDSGYKIGELDIDQCTATTFESDSVLGFVLYYSDVSTLISNWMCA